MAPAKSAKKPNTSAPGVKLLITTVSLAATLGGWAVISAKEPKPAAAPAPVPAQAAVPAVTIKLAPLPTLVPQITPRPQLVTVNQPRPAVSAPQPGRTDRTRAARCQCAASERRWRKVGGACTRRKYRIVTVRKQDAAS